MRTKASSEATKDIPMTVDALAALERAGFSRRRFLKGSGALIVGFSVSQLVGDLGIAPSSVAAQRLDGASSDWLDAWIAVAEDGHVTAYTGKCEFGQGIYTAQTQLIAEELAVPFDRITLIQCDTARCPDQGTTSGSQSHPTNFNQGSLALAAATARERLLGMASVRLRVPVAQLIASEGVISVQGDPSTTVAYGALIGGREFRMRLSGAAMRKRPREWTVLGTSVPRVDIPALATGHFEYVHNLRVPDMLHGRVVRPPAVGATLRSVDESSVREMPGFVKVVVKQDFVGVVAEKPWQAVRAARQLKVAWSPGTGLPAHSSFYEYLRNQKPTRDTLLVDSKDVDEKFAQAAHTVTATYYHPYQMHGSIGSSCAVAHVNGDQATVWSASQAAYAQKTTVAALLGLPRENVRIIYTMGSGCYGINGADAVTYDAALLSQGVGRPVRVQLSRQDEMAWENYGVPFVIDQRIAIDANGDIIAWDYESWSAELGGRPGNPNPMNPASVVTGMLAGFEPPAFVPRSPAPDPTGSFQNRRNDVPSYLAGCIGGNCGGTGTIKSERLLSHIGRSLFWTGPLRSPNRLQNTFAHECIMDEAAALAKADPLEYRLRHLADRRLMGVLNAAAKAANWDARPSPGPNRSRTGIVSGRGIACVLYEGDNGYGAMVAEVDVDQGTGQVVVKRLVIGQDCGPVSNPDGIRNQAEGGALQGMSRALMEEVTWDDEKITSIDWQTYNSLSLGSSMPTIETVLINQTEGKAMGAGEVSITLSAAAIGNAIFDATGARIRRVPFTPDRVKEALAGA
jgi:CO/xanthine dehydrogenase Mo-binding subunit